MTNGGEGFQGILPREELDVRESAASGYRQGDSKLLQTIERAAYPKPTRIQHVCVDHRRADIRVTEQFLHRADVVARFQQMRRETMSKRVTTPVLRDLRCTHRFFHRFLQDRWVKMMAALDFGSWIDRTLWSGEGILPFPLAVGWRLL